MSILFVSHRPKISCKFQFCGNRFYKLQVFHTLGWEEAVRRSSRQQLYFKQSNKRASYNRRLRDTSHHFYSLRLEFAHFQEAQETTKARNCATSWLSPVRESIFAQAIRDKALSNACKLLTVDEALDKSKLSRRAPVVVRRDGGRPTSKSFWRWNTRISWSSCFLQSIGQWRFLFGVYASHHRSATRGSPKTIWRRPPNCSWWSLVYP